MEVVQGPGGVQYRWTPTPLMPGLCFFQVSSASRILRAGHEEDRMIKIAILTLAALGVVALIAVIAVVWVIRRNRGN